MLNLLLALAATQAAAPATATAAPAARRLQDLPGITVVYRDLSEKDVKAINKSLSKNKPLTAEQKALLGASTNWNAGGEMTRLTKGTECTITKVSPTFKATATLPRFNEAWISAKDLPAWRAYKDATEAQAAAKLWFPYDRLPTVQQAATGKPCDQGAKDAAAAMDKLKAETAAFQPSIAVAQGAPAPLPAGAPRVPAPAATQAPSPARSSGGY